MRWIIIKPCGISGYGSQIRKNSLNYYRKGKMAKHRDYITLKKEFLEGEWRTVTDFCRDRGFPLPGKSVSLARKMKGWGKEKEELMKLALEKATEAIIEKKGEDVEQVKVRQARLARWVQLKGAEALKGLDPKSADEARKLILTGMMQERAALGIGMKGGAASLTPATVNLRKTRVRAN